MATRYWNAWSRRAAWSAATVLIGAGTAQALINPNYTPVDLVEQSDVVLALDIGPVKEEQAPPIRVRQVLKGQAPDGLAFDFAKTDRLMRDRFLQAFQEGATGPAMLFGGAYEGVEEDGFGFGGMGSDDAPPPKMYLLVDAPNANYDPWFQLVRTPGGRGWVLGDDRGVMKAVWAGGTRMFERCVRYVQTDADPVVPVRVGAEWVDRVKAATVPGKVHDLLAVDPFGEDGALLMVLAESGDRLLRFDREAKGFVDEAPRRGLESASRAAAWADLNGDGRLDLASCDGQKLTVWVQAADGTFAAKPAGVELPGGCVALAAADAGVEGKSGLLVSTSGVPVLLKPASDATFEARPIASAEEAKAHEKELATAGPCLLADFDGDAVADVLQPCARGARFYKGTGGGAFAPPKPAGDLWSPGEGVRGDTGDWDGDGRLDVALAGYEGCALWHNLGGGRFEGLTTRTGEIPYIVRPRSLAARTCEINNDGRQDVLFLYPHVPAQVFFNRGFACFGFAVEMDLATSGALPEAGQGQQAGTAADLTGDGAQDLALVLTTGEVWVLVRSAQVPPLGVEVRLAPAASARGPVRVTGWDRDRCLGAWTVAPGTAGSLVGLERPGARLIKWQFPGGEAQTKQVIADRGVVTVHLTPDAAAVAKP